MKVKLGQIWQDSDKRFQNIKSRRFLEVIGFPNDLMVQVRNTQTGRRTIISKDRFKPNSTGYWLHGEVPND